jgi:acyl-CoA thioesterase FadM
MHLNMAEHVRLFDDLADIALEELGIGKQYAAQSNKSFFASKIALQYHREIRAGERFVAEARLAAFDARRLLTELSLCNSGGEVASTALLEWAHVDLATRCSISLHDALLNTLRPIQHLSVERLPRMVL